MPIKKKRDRVWIIILTALMIFFILILIFLLGLKEKEIKFTFLLNESREPIEGEVFIKDISVGTLDNGSILIKKEKLKEVTEFLLIVTYQNEKLKFLFNLNPEDLQSDSSNFVLSQNQLIDKYWYINGPHWTHMPITYNIVNKKECGEYERNIILLAFNELHKDTEGTVSFREVNESGDIEINCSFVENCYFYEISVDAMGSFYKIITRERICAHTLGLAQITEYEGNKILKAKIELFGLTGFSEKSDNGRVYDAKKSGFEISDCGYPDTEIHEILHVFGYDHRNNPDSIMNPTAELIGALYKEDLCKSAISSIDLDIVEDLIQNYKEIIPRI